MSNVRWLAVTNDEAEHIVLDTKYLAAVGEFLGKNPSSVRSLVSKHRHHYKGNYNKWIGPYKVIRMCEED